MNRKILAATHRPNSVGRGTIVELHEDGAILVDVKRGKSSRRMLCDFLETAEGTGLNLTPGEHILVLLPRTLNERGCVLGRVGRYRQPDPGPPKEVTIKAKCGLKLTCGESSIEMRRDGKLRIQGVDLVSRAKRTNRIKGGSVQIN
jgi:hypothetical protein